MISKFNDVDVRDSALIYQSSLEQIKILYERGQKELAGELAICICEVALTGQHSSDDFMIDALLSSLKVVSEKNKEKYDSRREAQRQKKIKEQRLDEIAALLNAGLRQSQVAAKLSLTKQTVSNRVKKINAEYPELLDVKCQEKMLDCQEESIDLLDCQEESSKKDLTICQAVKKVKLNVNVNVNDNVSSSDEEELPLISLSELNQMGATYDNLGNGIIEFSTGKRAKIQYDF